MASPTHLIDEIKQELEVRRTVKQAMDNDDRLIRGGEREEEEGEAESSQ